MDFSSLINTEQLATTAVTYAPKLLAALLLFITFCLVYTFTKKWLRHICLRLQLEPAITKLIVQSVYKWSLITFGLLMALKQLGIDVGAVLAGLGVAGIAIGFAAQDTIANIIAGFVIFIDKPFKVGDWIEIDEYYGKVWEITLRSTRIQTLNHTYVIIPNKNIIDTTLDNHSKYGETRIEIPIGIAYKESVPEARKVLLQAINGIQNVLTSPAPKVVLKDLGDSSVNLVIQAWINNAEKERSTQYEIIEACKIALDAAKIQIPFPHMQLFVDNIEDTAVTQLQQVYSKK